MKEIEQIVTDYLKIEHSDFAIMINGDWGCGKTYYIKKILFDKINKIDSFEVGKKNEKLKYDPLYVSLYGISDINDVLYKVHLELNKWLKSKGWVLARTSISKFTSFFNINTSKEDEKNILSIFDIKKNRVLFFDDLERIDDKLSLSTVLGQINHFTEQDNLKVIIVCNNEKTGKIFNEINEKTVRFSCEYNPYLGDLYDSFIENYKGKYNEFLKIQKNAVLNIFKVAKYKNLRTLRFILDVFEKIYNEVKGKEYDEELLVRFFYFIAIYSVEYKTGQSKEDLKTIENAGPFSKMFGVNFERLMAPEKAEEVKEKEPSYYKIFTDKYQEIIENFNYSEEIAKYVHNGYLDKNKFAEEISEIQQEIRRNRGTDEQRLTGKIKNWRVLPDNEFLSTIEDVYTAIDGGKFTLVQFILIFSEFLQFEYYGLEGIVVNDQLIERFKKGIDIAKENHKYIEAFAYKLPVWSNRDTTPAKDKYYEVYNYVIEANDYALSKENVEVSTKLIDLIKTNKEKEIQDFISDTTLTGVPIFEHLNEKEVFDLILMSETTTISAFNWGLYGRYPEGDDYAHKSFLKDKNFLWEFQSLIEKHIEGIKDRKISTVQLIELNKNLMRIKKLKV